MNCWFYIFLDENVALYLVKFYGLGSSLNGINGEALMKFFAVFKNNMGYED